MIHLGMRALPPPRYGIRKNWAFILVLSLCFYFSYHLLMGDRSYGRLLGLHYAIERSALDFDRLARERAELERRVALLRPGSINRDFLEERARSVLGYRAPGEVDVIGKRE
jgi:cell division protein FtsB